MSQIGDVILSALRAMKDGKKWTTGVFQDEKGRMCATGAVNHALGLTNFYGWHRENEQWCKAMKVLAAHVPEDYDDSFGDQWAVARYNNSRKSFDDIREWFEKAALDEGVMI